MRALVLAAALVAIGACAPPEPEGDMGGVGGYVHAQGTGGARGLGGAMGTGGSAAAAVDALWSRYVDAAEAARLAGVAYTDAYQAALTAAIQSCGCRPAGCGPNDPCNPGARAMANTADQLRTFDAALAARDAAYEAYASAATAAGIVPMAKLS